jgi:pimeloyl-ACP methyl ester carboxylesterase
VIVASGRTAGIALLLASRHPERVGALVLIVPQVGTGRVPWASPGLVLASRIPPLGRFLYRFSMAREPFLGTWLARFGYADPSRAGEDVARNLAICAQQAGADHAILSTLGGRFAVDVASRLSRVPHRVAVVAAGSDTSAQALAAKLPSAEFIPLDPCGELAPLELADEIAAALGPLLSGSTSFQGAA